MPPYLEGNVILTNTATAADRERLREAGVRLLITTTPCLGGRSFGTNVLEAALVASVGADRSLTPARYEELIAAYGLEPSVEWL